MNPLVFIKRMLGIKDALCYCPWRNKIAELNGSNLKYDTAAQAYYAEFGSGEDSTILWFLYCPECGKRVAPLQQWEPEWNSAVVPSEERNRLAEVAKGIKTFEQVLAKFGKPQRELKILTYENLSTSASVSFSTGIPGEVNVLIHGKSTNDNKSPSETSPDFPQ